MLFLFQPSSAGLFQSIPALDEFNEIELLALKESLRSGTPVDMPRVRNFLGAAGLLDDEGKIVGGDLLSDMVTLAGLNAAGRSELIKVLPASSPLKKFHDQVLVGSPVKGAILVGTISKMANTDQPPKLDTEESFEKKLLAAFKRRGDFTNGKLSSPSLSSKPFRILWSYRGDLAEGYEQFFSKDQWEHRKLYQLISEGRIEELAKDHSAKSIAAFKSWHRMSDFRQPPLVTSHVFLHLGKNRLRFSLYCTSKKSESSGGDSLELLKEMTRVFHARQDQLGANWVIVGPPTHKNLSVSKAFPKKTTDSIDACISDTIQAWRELEKFLELARPSGY